MFKQIVAFGDSLTQMGSDPSNAGWVALIQNLSTGKADVLNRGFPGYTTRYARLILPQLHIDWKNTLFVTIFLGANDAEIPDHPDSGNVPISEFTANLREIVKYVLAQGIPSERIIMIAPPPVDEVKWLEMYKRQIRSNELTKLYSETVVAVAAETETKIIDIYSKVISMPNWKGFLSDGLHLSQEGNQLVFEEVYKIVAPALEQTPYCFPTWQEIDPQHPELVLVKNS